jgi:glucose/arabinose dehydrogenase
MKKVILFILVVLVVWGGLFAYRNLRGIAPAVRPTPQISDLLKTDAPSQEPGSNTTGIPLTFPSGISLSFFARDLGAPRVLRFDPKGVLLASIPSRGQVVALPDANGDGVADETIIVARGLRIPHGFAFHDGKLFIAETDQIATYDYDANTHAATNKRKIVDLPAGGNHVTRTIDIGPDGRLYISVGSSCNVCNEKDARRAKILVANADGGNLRDYAAGLRNSVFFIWDAGGRMWATDMGRDLIGDDIPPDEINIIEDGRFYGWPYCYGQMIWDRQFDSSQEAEDRCEKSAASRVDLQAHSAPLGLRFIPESWGNEYKGDLLVAFHGSWNRTTPTGYKVVRIKLDKSGNLEGVEDFITGWLGGAQGASGAHGRPVDIIFDAAGVGYISDDKAGVLYRLEI